MLDLDKKFIQKVITNGGVEKDVLVKRYQSYIWAIINKKIGKGDGMISLLFKDDIFQYIFLKMFENDDKALRDYLEKYEIPFKNYLSFYVSSRIIDYIRKEVKNQGREVSASVDTDDNEGSSELENIPANDLTPEEHMECQDFNKIILQYENKIKGKDKEIFRLICEGSSSGLIAKELGLEIKYVYKKTYELKRELKEILKRELK